MEAINIEITKAKISSFNVELRDRKPVISATIKLMTNSGKEITTYTIATEHWQDHMKFDLPVEVVGPVLEIARQLEYIVAKHCQSSCKQLQVLEAEAVNESL